MAKQLLKSVLLITAVLLGTLGIVTLTFRLRALDPATYERALAPSGVYRELRFTLEDQFITSTIGEEALGTPFAEDIVSKLDLPSVTITMMERNIEQLFAWINKESDELRLFIPFDELAAEISNLEVSDFSFAEIEQRTAGLEPCTIWLICRMILTLLPQWSCRPIL